MSNLINSVVDDGFKNNKGLAFLDGEVKKTITPTAIRSGSHGITDYGGNSKTTAYRTNGSTFTVGGNVEGVTTRFDNYPFSDANRILVQHTLLSLGLSGKRVCLATGLPFQIFYSQSGQPDQDVIDNKIKNLLSSENSIEILSGDMEPVEIVEHYVYSEALATVISHYLDDEGNDKGDVPDGFVAVQDIGGNTTDVVVINLQDQTIDHAKSGTVNLGMLDVIHRFKAAISKKHDVDGITDHQSEQAILTGSMSIWGEVKDITEILDAIVKQVANEINAWTQNLLGSPKKTGYLTNILHTGGSMTVFKEQVMLYKQSVMLKEPIYSNSDGMLKNLMYLR